MTLTRHTAVWAAVVATVFVLGCGGNPDDDDDAKGFARPVATSASPSPSVDDGTRGVGVWEVGVTLMPGKWQTTAPADSWGCYWQRSTDATGSFESIIANGNIAKGAPAILQVAATDKYVKFDGPCRWTKTG